MENTQITRRHLFSLGAGASVAALAGGCALFQQNANGSYGLSSAVISFIQSAVSIANQYIPSAESIAAIVAAFIPGGTAVVTVGSTFINQVISYLENLVTTPPTLGARYGQKSYARLGLPTPPASKLVGYTKVGGVPVFAQ